MWIAQPLTVCGPAFVRTIWLASSTCTMPKLGARFGSTVMPTAIASVPPLGTIVPTIVPNGGTDAIAVGITVLPNLAPSFGIVHVDEANQMVRTNAGPQTVSGWAIHISAGAGETSQTVNFIVTNNNNALFLTQ